MKKLKTVVAGSFFVVLLGMFAAILLHSIVGEHFALYVLLVLTSLLGLGDIVMVWVIFHEDCPPAGAH